MQLDLLQEGLFPVTQDTQPIHQKKSKPVLSPKLHDVPLKPLPASLQPSLASIIPVLDSGVRTAVVQEEEDEKPKKNADAFKTISEAATFLGVPQHVLRFWESRFSQIKPLKLAGGRRYYRPDDMEILTTIKHLLYKQGYTIKGAKKAFSSRKSVVSAVSIDQEIQPFPEVKQRVYSKKQKSQLAGIRQELIGLRESLSVLMH